MCTNWNEYEVSKCTNSQISLVDAMPETASPGPYSTALTVETLQDSE